MRQSIWKGMAAGALGGAAASFAMNRFQAAASRLFEHPRQDEQEKRRARQAQGWKEHRERGDGDEQEKRRARQAQGWKEHRERGDGEEENATVKAAVAVAEAAGTELNEEEKRAGGNAMHYAFGIVTGALYGATVEKWPAARAGTGMVFGAAVWVAADEVAVPAFGLSKPPRAYPARVHAMALGSHLIYGLVTELTRRALRRGLRGRRRS
jgi:hypothetical protein